MLRSVALVRTNVLEECITSIIRIRISEIETTFLQNVGSYRRHIADIPEDSILQSLL
jgi:hypothetical protein